MGYFNRLGLGVEGFIRRLGAQESKDASSAEIEATEPNGVDRSYEPFMQWFVNNPKDGKTLNLWLDLVTDARSIFNEMYRKQKKLTPEDVSRYFSRMNKQWMNEGFVPSTYIPEEEIKFNIQGTEEIEIFIEKYTIKNREAGFDVADQEYFVFGYSRAGASAYVRA